MKDGTHCCPERSVEYQLELLLPTTYNYVFVCLHFGILYRYLLPTIRYSRHREPLGARCSVLYSVLGTIQVPSLMVGVPLLCSFLNYKYI